MCMDDFQPVFLDIYSHSERIFSTLNWHNLTEKNTSRLKQLICNSEYFPEGSTIGMISRYGPIKKVGWKFNQKAIVNLNELKQLLHFFMRLNDTENLKELIQHIITLKVDSKTKKEILAARFCVDGESALFMALRLGHKDAVEIFITYVLTSTLDPKDKKEILAARLGVDSGSSGLHKALYYGYADTAEFYINIIFQNV